VAIVQDAVTLRLKISGPYDIVDTDKARSVYRGRDLNTTVTAYKYGFLLGNIRSSAAKLSIKPGQPDAITINGRRFRGSIQLVKKDSLHFWAINYLDPEDYIKGILYHEASHYWPQEALKAQAVVCRTYAEYQIRNSRLKDYDVTSDVYSQVYGGQTSERYRTNKAVEDTRGTVLVYKGELFPAYYHATCAGRTEDAAELWDINIEPLKGVRCGFCTESPHFNWHYVLTKEELGEKLKSAGYATGNIKDIVIAERNKSGRIANLKILSDAKELLISGKDFRSAIGPNLIRSTNFEVAIAGEDVVFEGLGWGHGVGLCQWGAYFMAKAGYKYDQILKYYYPGADIASTLLN
jgi:stage II sporulation protein D